MTCSGSCAAFSRRFGRADARQRRRLVVIVGAVALRRGWTKNWRSWGGSRSADGLWKPPRKSLRRRSGRRRGGQEGHGGGNVEKIAVRDEIVDHVPPVCAGCHGDLSDSQAVGHLA